MLQRRRCFSGCDFPELLFYAPLTVDKFPTYSWDGNISVYYLGSGSINNNQYYNPSNTTGYRVYYNSRVPEGKNMSFSAFLTPTNYNSGYHFSTGFAPRVPSGTWKYMGIWYSKYYTNNYNSLNCDWINPFSAAPEILTPLNAKTFLTWTIIFEGNHYYTVKYYTNGVFRYTEKVYRPEWLELQGYQNSGTVFSIGYISGSNNFVGYVSHYSVYEELSDKQVMKLYQNGGVPK